jgi:hypothetical protein
MPRKPTSIFYVYKTTCIITGNYYIGMHATSNINDGYMGSGRRLKMSINKHGLENHTKEILEFLADKKSLINREIQLVNEDLLNDPNCMNLMRGGDGGGGFRNDEHRIKFLRSGTEASAKSGKCKDTMKKLLADPDWAKAYKEKMSKSLTGLKRKTPIRNKHSEETKSKMRKPHKSKV